MIKPLLRILWAIALTASAGHCYAQATVAVATNFALTAERLREAFRHAGGKPITLVNGSTGKLYAQITQGAPFDLFLAADTKRPERLVEQRLAIAKTRVTYALGTLVLWQPDASSTGAKPLDRLTDTSLRRLAIANPQLAPYGTAAQQTLARLQLPQTIANRVVRGQNIGQAFAMVASGNAELGFVAASQLNRQRTALTERQAWVVPATFHDPIVQQAVLLTHGEHNATAIAFLTYLQTKEAQALIAADGYRTSERLPSDPA